MRAVLYQKKPILRVVLPGSVPPSELHCDADYFHDANEINFWVRTSYLSLLASYILPLTSYFLHPKLCDDQVPITPVWGSNSLWAESAAGVGDFAPFEALPGQVPCGRRTHDLLAMLLHLLTSRVRCWYAGRPLLWQPMQALYRRERERRATRLVRFSSHPAAPLPPAEQPHQKQAHARRRHGEAWLLCGGAPARRACEEERRIPTRDLLSLT